ncbi:hypothetical protein MHM93_14025 [Pseudoalteromonas sp. MM17-2]|uniref:hypothetical protein n=1 Tax=Pseudoalteromonas TaxID=53246 RepID=UPI001EF73D74|nr:MULTISPECIES: hypothetical protein [Pseudoalteromonas]MCG7545294.1 hypothetical protein [Pseudoalteromonas sp. MM17-2]
MASMPRSILARLTPRHLAATVLMLISIGLAAGSIAALQGNLAYLQGKTLLSHLQLQQDELEPAVGSTHYMRAHMRLQRAAELVPNHAQYHTIQAQLSLYGFAHGYADGVELRTAKEQLLHSLSLRPSWPYTWLELAKVSYSLDGINDSVWQYLKQAQQYGPFIKEVNITSVEFYLLYYAELNAEQRQALRTQLQRALVQRDGAWLLWERAQLRMRKTLLCHEVAKLQQQHQVMNNLCKRAQANFASVADNPA